jgi:uncharacterized protein YybS (DUF2232 family)
VTGIGKGVIRLPPSIRSYVELAISTAIFALPSISGVLSLLVALIPLPVLYNIHAYGQKQGLIATGKALALAVAATAIAGALPSMLFTCTLMPAGYAIAMAAQKRFSPEKTGLHGMIALSAVWLIFWTLFGVLAQKNPFADMREGMLQHLDAVYALYSTSSELPQAAVNELEALFSQLRTLVSKLFPGLLLTSALWTIWLNLLLGHKMLKRQTQTGSPWPDYRCWRLPDHLVWLVIVTAVFVLLPGEHMPILGANMALVLGVTYLFQGLAVCAHFLERWAVPRPLRLIIFAVVLLQVYGIIMLALIGLAEVWLNMRKLPEAGKQP